MVNCQGSYYSVSYGPTALKICHDTVHQKVADSNSYEENIIYPFWSWLKIASLGRQEPLPAGTSKWPTTLRFWNLLRTTSVVRIIENPQDVPQKIHRP